MNELLSMSGYTQAKLAPVQGSCYSLYMSDRFCIRRACRQTMPPQLVPAICDDPAAAHAAAVPLSEECFGKHAAAWAEHERSGEEESGDEESEGNIVDTPGQILEHLGAGRTCISKEFLMEPASLGGLVVHETVTETMATMILLAVLTENGYGEVMLKEEL